MNYTLGKTNMCDLNHSTNPMWWQNIVPTLLSQDTIDDVAPNGCTIYKQKPL
jgi:hypothetical protein